MNQKDKILYKATGTLKYAPNWRLTVEIDQELADYYRSLIPKWKKVQKPMFPPHVTVCRAEHEEPTNKEAWGKYDGQQIEYYYSPIIHEGTVFYWLNIFSCRLEEIRLELGLPVVSEYTIPPEGFIKCFHSTLGNKK